MPSSTSLLRESHTSDIIPYNKVGVASGSFDKYYANNLSPEKIFGIGSDPFSGGGWYMNNVQIPRRDEILNQKFGGNARAIEGYMKLLNDSTVLSSLDKFISEITQRPFNVIPASTSATDEYIAEFVRQCLFQLGYTGRQSTSKGTIAYNSDGYNQLTHSMAESYILGISGAGIVWVKQGKHIIPTSIQAVDPRRIEISMNERGDIVPKLTVWQQGYLGVELPARTFILHRHWSNRSYQDPWGFGLGRQLYPLVEFRRNIMSMWLQYCDKNTTPNVIVNYPLGISKEDHNKIFETVKHFGQSTVALFPEEVKAQYLTPSSSAPQTYMQVIDYMDQQISWLITGEKESSQSGQVTGSVPQQERLADSNRVKKAKLFNDGLEASLNNSLIRWIVELNFGFDVTPPVVTRNFTDLTERTNKQAILGQISMLKGMGYTINDLDWIKEQMEIPSLSYDPQLVQSAEGMPTEEDVGGAEAIEPEPEPIGGGAEVGGSFAEPSDMSDSMVRLEEVANILAIDPGTLMEVLGLTSPDDLVDVDKLIGDFLDNEPEETVQQIKQKYKEDKLGSTEYYRGLSQDLQSVNETPETLPEDGVTSQEQANKEISEALRGTPRQIGYDLITSTMTPFEQSKLNMIVTKHTPSYEVIYAILETLEEISNTRSRDIRPVVSQEDWLKFGKLQRKAERLRSIYTQQDVRYESIILKEMVREFQFNLYNGFEESPYNYDSRIENMRGELND